MCTEEVTVFGCFERNEEGGFCGFQCSKGGEKKNCVHRKQVARMKHRGS